MPRIPSANADFKEIQTPSSEDAYVHPASTRRGAIPLAFQVTSPFNRNVLLLPHALVMHVNPASLQETFTQKIERMQTRGGFVEQHWGSELTDISADGSTGAFMNIYTGLTSVLRQKTIAWDRYRDLRDLFDNNGSVHDPFGNIVLQGQILLMYDRGNYLGTFRTFETEETDDSPFAFHLNWSFKVEKTLLAMSSQISSSRAPKFQGQNTLAGTRSTASTANQTDIQNQLTIRGKTNAGS
jgi:hypothetical protein